MLTDEVAELLAELAMSLRELATLLSDLAELLLAEVRTVVTVSVVVTVFPSALPRGTSAGSDPGLAPRVVPRSGERYASLSRGNDVRKRTLATPSGISDESVRMEASPHIVWHAIDDGEASGTRVDEGTKSSCRTRGDMNN